jgi:hypothetical protein
VNFSEKIQKGLTTLKESINIKHHLTKTMEKEIEIELEVSPEYIKQMQTEGMYASMNMEEPEFPHCPYYMQGYKSVYK